MSVKTIKSRADLQDAINTSKRGKLVILDFSATWCPPCRYFAPKLKCYAEKYKDDIVIYVIDVGIDDNEEIAKEQNINSMPTFLFFKNGRQVGIVKGVADQNFRQMIEEHK